ncbi:TPA: hypothetical protein ACSE23_002765 [Acinetobacter baumannii]|uniref:hypothetical protein n=1 Tax=Acinetobacter TaxID=469 RepID=UPI0004506064|nr:MULTISPECIES: hypothetical protein [Acinetobacter]EHU2650175.1 hypothetical protein [Acinetobacter baumannii]EHU2652379.1 hypothetical protein [Acinetobacter baumannii]EKV3837097.1 hypothetical protein [Acinetobacter baumannii]EKV6048981.1 hypothetical protein [Acinetobacter baumannii]EKV7789374.1 hypothetical protein [Acinetobacter baumannii]
MEINGKTVPFTATHYHWHSREFLRIGKHGYAQCLINGKHWVDCGNLTNAQLVAGEHRTIMKLFKTGLSRDICNMRLFFIGSTYRIG